MLKANHLPFYFPPACLAIFLLLSQKDTFENLLINFQKCLLSFLQCYKFQTFLRLFTKTLEFLQAIEMAGTHHNPCHFCTYNKKVFENSQCHWELLSSSTISVNSSSFFCRISLLISFVRYSEIMVELIFRLRAYSTTSSSLLLQRIMPTLGFSWGFFTSRSNASR